MDRRAGVYLADREAFVRARLDATVPSTWQLLHVRGRWRTDAWGEGWFEEEMEKSGEW